MNNKPAGQFLQADVKPGENCPLGHSLPEPSDLCRVTFPLDNSPVHTRTSEKVPLNVVCGMVPELSNVAPTNVVDSPFGTETLTLLTNCFVPFKYKTGYLPLFISKTTCMLRRLSKGLFVLKKLLFPQLTPYPKLINPLVLAR